ncbi:MAG: N-acetylmuramoyl-L-alanine amidase [Cyanobacteria bacterium P01_H01_bin.15]
MSLAMIAGVIAPWQIMGKRLIELCRMLKFRWLVLSCLGLLLLSASPAWAGRLLFWRYDNNQNRLTFSTDSSVQPQAKLIANPTRLVIDLPGTTLGQPTVNQPVGGLVRSVRLGQFNSFTSRVVIELAPGYTLDPQQVKFRGISSTQWQVDLPAPIRITAAPPTQRPPLPSTRNNPPASAPETETSLVRLTRNGIVIAVEGDRSNEIKYKRRNDDTEIEIRIDDLVLPSELADERLIVNEFGVSEMAFEQEKKDRAKITLFVDEDGPDWQASFSRLGGLVLLPAGGVSSTARDRVTPRSLQSATASTNQSEPIRLLGATLDRFTRVLELKLDRNLQTQSQWLPSENAYEIRLPGVQVSEDFQGPQLLVTSSIRRLRLRPQADGVVLLVEPAQGFRVKGVNSQNESIQIQLEPGLPPLSNQPPPSSSRVAEGIAIFVPPPERYSAPSPPPSIGFPPNQSPVRTNGRVLVVIDPGHGGKDPGAVGRGGLQEKNVILPISLQVKRLLESQGIAVQMTRDSDYFISLAGRSNLANRANATLFVSIHANAINLSRPDINGLETYYYRSGRELAQVIHNTVLRNVNIRDRRVRQARFYVLRKSAMPAVLVEVGFVTGAEDAPKLSDPNFRNQMAAAIAEGIVTYVQQKRL